MYEPSGKLHQPTTDELPDRDWPYEAPRTGPIALYFAGLIVPSRPDLATGYDLLVPAVDLTVLSAILYPVGWTAAGAAPLTLGSASDPSIVANATDLVGLSDGFRSDAIFRIGPDNALVATVTGSPTAGLLSVYLLAAVTSSIVAATWTDDTQTYRLS